MSTAVNSFRSLGGTKGSYKENLVDGKRS